jgi:hypothetical protein
MANGVVDSRMDYFPFGKIITASGQEKRKFTELERNEVE